MDKQEIIDYVMKTPNNSNPSVLKSMLNNFKSEKNIEETYRVDMNSDNYGTLSSALNEKKLLYIDYGNEVYYLTGYGTSIGGIKYFDFSSSSAEMVHMYEYTYNPNTEVQEWRYIEQAAKMNEPAQDGTAGQVLTTDGNGGRSWTTVSGADSDLFIIHYSITSSNGEFVASCEETSQEIIAAIDDGKHIVGNIDILGESVVDASIYINNQEGLDGIILATVAMLGNRTSLSVIGITHTYTQSPMGFEVMETVIGGGGGGSTASDITISDAGEYFTSGNVEGALQEIGAELFGLDSLIGNGVII